MRITKLIGKSGANGLNAPPGIGGNGIAGQGAVAMAGPDADLLARPLPLARPAVMAATAA